MSPRTITAFAFAALVAACSPQPPAQDTRGYVNPQSPGSSGGPFSGAVLAGNTLYVSGTLGLGSDRQVPATAEAEARNVLDNVKGTLADAGMTMDDLVSVQVFSSDVADYAAFNEVYRTYFEKEFPARAFVGAGPLLFGARFEVLGVAVKR
ncbi:MAG: RidA family protein [Gemmatimonadota bacterium]|uniref:RidA family protein n=1 Tax=marine metagenome TaxID=408172 RepID=A0A382IMD1_9ZZZZ|nr:RidA family protein [Gemmatimonadota bacterium]